MSHPKSKQKSKSRNRSRTKSISIVKNTQPVKQLIPQPVQQIVKLRSKLVCVEIEREKEWEDISNKFQQLISLPKKESSMMLLRYFFNKNNDLNCNHLDPVFITGKSESAREQIKQDLIYFKSTKNYERICDYLDFEFVKAKQVIQQTIFECYSVSYFTKGDKLIIEYSGKTKEYLDPYGKVRKEIIKSLHSEDQTKNLSEIYALLAIRYQYMKLSTQGLSVIYEAKGFKPNDDVTEGFGGAFNHYFDRWCCTFYEETLLGGLGNFFTIKTFSTSMVYVNPPFDTTVLDKVYKKISNYVNHSVYRITFIVISPSWKDFQSLNDFKKDKNAIEVNEYKKGEYLFIDRFTGQKIAPVAITEVIIQN